MKVAALLIEHIYSAVELERLINMCNKRLKKGFDILRYLLTIDHCDLTITEKQDLKNVNCFIRSELILRRGCKKKYNQIKFINN